MSTQAVEAEPQNDNKTENKNQSDSDSYKDGDVIVKVENLTKVFGDNPKKALPLLKEGKSRAEIQNLTGQTVGVANASFEVKKGEIFVIMGLSGSGKSTLVRLINRLIEPTGGKVIIENQDVTAMDESDLLEIRRHKVGMVFQRFALFPHYSILRNAAYGLEVMGVDKEEREKRAKEVLDLVGLKGWEDCMPEELSGGMQQRVGLARAIAVNPDIILMDEALSALDPLIRKDMQNEIIELQRRLDKTVLFITHDLDEAINMGDRIIIMKDGYIVQQGTAEDILTNPANDYVARFVEDVDMSRVITAGSIMKKVHSVAHAGDGPRTVLHKMKEDGISSMFVTDNQHTLKGFVKAQQVKDAIEKGCKRTDQFMEDACKTVTVDKPIQEIIPLMAENNDPVAVVSEEGKLKGVVVTGALLAGLAEGLESNVE